MQVELNARHYSQQKKDFEAWRDGAEVAPAGRTASSFFFTIHTLLTSYSLLLSLLARFLARWLTLSPCAQIRSYPSADLSNVDMRLYHNLLGRSTVPCRLPLLLHCMFEQVAVEVPRTLSTQLATQNQMQAPYYVTAMSCPGSTLLCPCPDVRMSGCPAPGAPPYQPLPPLSHHARTRYHHNAIITCSHTAYYSQVAGTDLKQMFTEQKSDGVCV